MLFSELVHFLWNYPSMEWFSGLLRCLTWRELLYPRFLFPYLSWTNNVFLHVSPLFHVNLNHTFMLSYCKHEITVICTICTETTWRYNNSPCVTLVVKKRPLFPLLTTVGNTYLTSGLARTFGAHGQWTLRGPSPYFITLFLWPLPNIHTYSDFAHIYIYYMILNTHFLINTYLIVYFGNLGPFDDMMGEMGAPWWCNDRLNRMPW